MPRCSGCKRFVFKAYDGECADCNIATLKVALESWIICHAASE